MSNATVVGDPGGYRLVNAGSHFIDHNLLFFFAGAFFFADFLTVLALVVLFFAEMDLVMVSPSTICFLSFTLASELA